jgi:hypothetical protein
MNHTKQNNQTISRSSLLLLLAFAFALVAIGVISRIVLVGSPNFKPVCALALFAGFYFSRTWLAAVVVGLILVVSDLMIGGYEWQLMAAVYGSTFFAVLLGVVIRNRQSRSPGGMLFGRFAAASLAMSATFFVLTNFAVWAFGGWYPTTWSGLVDCYVAAIPFFRWTLVSDFVFSQALVAAFTLSVAWTPSTNRAVSDSRFS